MDVAYGLTALAATKLVVYTFGSLIHLFLIVLILGNGRLGRLQVLLLALMSALFLWYAGNLLALNISLYYGAGPAVLSGFSRTISIVGLVAAVPLLVHLQTEYFSGFVPMRLWQWLLVGCFYLPAIFSPWIVGRLLSHPGVEPLVALGRPVRWLAVWAVSGLFVGLLVGLTGVGGGSLMTPLLILLFGIHPSTAVGTDLLYAAVTKTVGSGVHGFNHNIDWKIVRRLATGSVPATIVTILLLGYFGTASKHETALISNVLAIALVFSAVTLALKGPILRAAMQRNPDFGVTSSLGLTILTGVVLGVLVTISSVGAGALGTTALLFLYPRLPTVKIIGSDIAHAVPLTLIAGVGHWYLGNINFHLLTSLLCGSIPGIIIGSLTTRFVPETGLRLALAAVLVLVAVKLVFG